MKTQFVTYELGVKFRELGFNEKCCGFFRNEKLVLVSGFTTSNDFSKDMITAPLWQQAYNFLTKKLDFHYPMLELQIFSDESGTWVQSYDELTNNEEVDIVFDNIEQMIWEAIKLLENAKV